MRPLLFEDKEYKKKILYSSVFFEDNSTITKEDMEASLTGEFVGSFLSSQTVTAVFMEGIMVNLTKKGAGYVEPPSFYIEYVKKGMFEKEEVEIIVKRRCIIHRVSMEWQIEKTQNQVKRFSRYNNGFINQKIPGEEFFIILTEANIHKKDDLVREKARDVLAKLPLPIKSHWLDEIIEGLVVVEMKGANESDPKHIFKVSLPKESELEKMIVSAYKSELWLKHHKQAPRLDSVKNGVFLIETFELKKWMTFIKQFGLDKFKGYSYNHQIGIVSIVELIGADAALKAIKKFGVPIWHSIETKSFFKSRRELNLIPNRDIPKIDSILAEINDSLDEDPENPILIQDKSQFEKKKAIMVERLAELNETKVESLIYGISDVIKAAWSEDDAAHKNNSLLRNGIENIDRLVPYMAKKGYKFTRKNLRQALMDLEYKHVRFSEVARVCSRAKVSQAEFEIYQDLWEQNQEARERASVRIPTLSGKVGNLEWEMCDVRDENILTAGNETNCCQHPLSLGGACVTYMLQNPETSTIFRATKKGSDKTIIQSFVWVDEENNRLCFDNIESLKGIDDSVLQCYKDYVEQVQNHKIFSFDSMTLGVGYTKVSMAGLESAGSDKIAKIPSSLSYTDARNQILLSKKPSHN